MSPTFTDAILEINPSARFGYSDENLDYLEWLEGTTPIAKADIIAKKKELDELYIKNEYQRLRKIEYDQLNQFELMTDDAANGTTNHSKAILAIKDKYPKE